MAVNSIRESVSHHTTNSAKLCDYSCKVSDVEIQDLLKEGSQRCERFAKELLQFL